MTKTEFEKQVDALIQKAEALQHGDYQEAIAVADEFDTFFGTNHEHIHGQYGNEHVGTIKAAFELASETKDFAEQLEHFRRGKRNLVGDISALRDKYKEDN